MSYDERQLLMMRVSSDESENPGQQMQYSRTWIFISHTHKILQSIQISSTADDNDDPIERTTA
ncbi:hypothetical protein PDE_05407 [Penicillium oxalicum 114-2]|uniref:Uncharacterized protein n=1 Tax=Penicillium oxalicum (strain 114-2 / CGMCC 5302) TaxID=933388 RepID=S7ZP81_PENO1|nr:hypothetical protein PDE_05407 [Penicillium oxalicum 114-2]